MSLTVVLSARHTPSGLSIALDDESRRLYAISACCNGKLYFLAVPARWACERCKLSIRLLKAGDKMSYLELAGDDSRGVPWMVGDHTLNLFVSRWSGYPVEMLDVKVEW